MNHSTIHPNLLSAWGYVRLSQDDGDKQESNSIANQKLLIKDFAKKHPEIKLKDIKEDDGYSGVNFNRPGFQALMQAIRNGTCNCVIVKDLSRFGRNYIEVGKYIQQVFPLLGVRFIAINDNYDSLTSTSLSDNMMLPFKNLINDMYSRDISIKVRSQFEVRRKRGDFVGSFVTYGYLKSKENKNRLVIDDHAADVVRCIFRWKLEGMSQFAIANLLNNISEPSPMEYKNTVLGLNYASSFKVKSKALWSAQAVGRILKNKIYIGVTEQKKETTPNYKVQKRIIVPEEQRICVANTHEAIIDKKTFDLVQELLAGKHIRAGKDQDSVYLFSGMLICDKCGHTMVAQMVSYKKTGKIYIYYYCNECQKSQRNRINEKQLYSTVLNAIRSYIENIAALDRVMKSIGEIPYQQSEVKKIEHQISKKQQELDRYTRLKRSLHEDYSEGLLSKEEMQEYYAVYNENCENARRMLRELHKQMEEILENGSIPNEWVQQFMQYRNFTELSRSILVSIVKEIVVVNPTEIHIHFNYSKEFLRTTEIIDELQSLPVAQ